MDEQTVAQTMMTEVITRQDTERADEMANDEREWKEREEQE